MKALRAVLAMALLWAVALGQARHAQAWAANSESPRAAQPVRIGSKKFTESYVLAEIARRAAAKAGLSVDLRQGMGGTIILWQALSQGAIACYPEYTGTIREIILKQPRPATVEASVDMENMRRQLLPFGVGMTGPLGFNNSYALLTRRSRAQELGIHKISDLKKHPGLRVGLSHEFLGRADGWGPLSARYGLHMTQVQGLDHALAYTALAKSEIDVMDAYTTDAKIAGKDLVALVDDLGFFPLYQAVFLYRLDADPRLPQALRRLEGTLTEARMNQLNEIAERTRNYAQAAALYFNESIGSGSPVADVTRWTRRHLLLVGLSLAASILVGLPLGIWASRPGWASEVILGATGLIQTIPSLALLAMLVSIPFLGISPLTAIIALFLYGLLPIVRNTASGLQDIPRPLRESAEPWDWNRVRVCSKSFSPWPRAPFSPGSKPAPS